MAFISVNDQDKRAVAFIAREHRAPRLLTYWPPSRHGAPYCAHRACPAEVTGKIHEGEPGVCDADRCRQDLAHDQHPASAWPPATTATSCAAPPCRHGITYATTLAAAQALIAGMQAARAGELDVAPLQEL